MLLEEVSTTVAVASGKGGVGKTFVAVELAKTLADAGAEVGVLDVDLTTPDSDRAAGMDSGNSHTTDRGASESPVRPPGTGSRAARLNSPVKVDGIQLVTKGTELPDFAVNTNDERMQLESVMAFIRDTDWDDETTHVVVDTPPGTGWEIQTVLRDLHPDFGFVVTTGTVNSVRNACRTHELFRRVGLDHAVIANMRRTVMAIDRERLRDRLTTIDGVEESFREEIVDVVVGSVGKEVPLHDDGIDLTGRFSVPVVADIPFTSETETVREELRRAIERVGLTSTIPG